MFKKRINVFQKNPLNRLVMYDLLLFSFRLQLGHFEEGYQDTVSLVSLGIYSVSVTFIGVSRSQL